MRLHNACRRSTAPIGTALVAALATTALAGIAKDDILAIESDATDFVGLAPNERVPNDTLVGVDFHAPGSVVFFQSPPFYLIQSNRAWGLVGPGTARIEFKVPPLSVTLAGRGSADGDTMGPIFKNAPFAESDAVVHALDAKGARLATEKLPNLSLRGDDAELIVFEGIGAIKFLEIEQRAMAKNAAAVVGGIGVTFDCLADIDGSDDVSFGDIVAILAAWGECKDCRADLDLSGAVDFGDLLQVLAAFGPCP